MDNIFDEHGEARRSLESAIIKAVMLNMPNEINKQTSAFSTMVHDQALGVQRVYDEMQKLVARVAKLEMDKGEKEEEEIDLKTCPFCGSWAELSEVGLADYQIECSACDVRTAVYDNKDDAINTWNYRL